MSNKEKSGSVVKDPKSIETRPVLLFRKNRIYVINTTEYPIELLVSQEPHEYEINNNKLTVKAVTLVKYTGKDKDDKKEPERHEISIDGIKAYVSLFMYSEEQKSIGNIFENRLLKKEQILIVKDSHAATLITHLKKNEPPTIIPPSIVSPDTKALSDQNRHVQSENLKKILSDYPQKEYTQSRYIGGGSYGSVYLGHLQEESQLVAVKQLNIIPNGDDAYFKNLGSFFEEIKILKHLDHPNIVKYIYACVSSQNGIPKHLNIFLEFCAGGSIADIISNNKIGEQKVSQYTKQILLALTYLHEKGFIHRDVKGSNILLDEKGNIKLADFGCSKFFNGSSVSSTLVGTPNFIAPEVVNGEYGRSSDIFSLGCTVIQMITGNTPSIMQTSASRGSLKSGLPQIPADLSTEVRDFLNLCLKEAPNERKTAAELLNHKFITQHNS